MTNEKNEKTVRRRRFSPSEWMRRRRPELYSDTTNVDEPQLSPEVFGYHLETLTNRGEENFFANFARRLCEKEVCPNLVPQTGPTGGGDSKVDTETHPVSEAIAEGWFEGLGTEAATERWGFAFSAKKDWLPKVRSDIAKAVATKRGYTKIFFVTNQFVPDKKRSEIQDELTKKHGCSVTIYDRTWIADRVFSHHREQLAIETLGLTNVQQSKKSEVGPLDQERNKELEELEAQISDPSRYQGFKYHRVEDCLRAARLARGLEKTRVDVEGRFARARQLADKVGDRRQRLRVIYEYVWTEFWWYDDFDQLNKLYDEVEALAVGSEEVADLELLGNVWTVLFNTVAQAGLSKSDAKLEARTALFESELSRLAADEVRITSAAQARTQRQLMDLMQAMHGGDIQKVNTALNGFNEVLDVAITLGSYPFDFLVKLFRDIGPAFVDNDAFEQLFERLVSLFESRKSDIEGGRLLLTRGFQKLEANRYQEALRLFGRAQERLVKHESRQDLVRSLFGCGLSYDGLGLPWAAWSCFVAAAVTSLAELKDGGVVVRSALLAVQRLEWLDLKLARIPYVLAWRELADMMAAHRRLQNEELDEFNEERTLQDATLGLLMLRASIEELSQLVKLPPVFESLNLPLADVALNYAAGQEDKMRAEGLTPKEEPAEETRKYFVAWLNQPIAKDLADQIVLIDQAGFRFEAIILGCSFTAAGRSEPTAIHLAESLFAGLEAFLATSLEDVQPYLEKVSISIEEDPARRQLTTTTDRSSGELVVTVKYPVDYELSTPVQREAFRNWLVESIANIMSACTIMKDAPTHLEKLARDERVFSRVLLFADSSIGVENILGDKPKIRLSDWLPKDGKGALEVLRTEKWDGPQPEGKKSEPAQPGDGPPPPEFNDLGKFGHRDRRISSVIDIPLWDQAKWRGTAFLHYGPPYPPLFGFLFENQQAAAQIFAGWRKRFNGYDENNQIRLSVITGVSQKNPHAYKVVVGTNIMTGEMESGTLFLTTTRFNTMTPTSSKNLDLFLQQQRLAGSFGIVPVSQSGDGGLAPATDLVIGRTEIIVRPAWEIGEHDPESVALLSDDDIIIPDGVQDAPILRVFARRKERGQE